MMKKLLIAFLVAFLGNITHLVYAYDFQSGGIYYEIIEGNNVAVTYGDNEYTGNVTIPKQVYNTGKTYIVASIRVGAFAYCRDLTSITIPNSVTSIYNPFSGCSSLTSIKVESGNTKYDSRNNCNAIIETSSNRLIAGCKNTTIPNSVTSIGGSAFLGCSSLTSITIPSSVTSIGEHAFEKCSGFTSITIPNSVSSIGYAAFSGCSGLTSIKVESGNTKYDSRNNCNAIIETSSNRLITGCKNTTIPSSVTSIDDGAFWGCCDLTSIAIPSSVTSIGGLAFSDCSGLTSLTIPISVTSIGGFAFQNCSGLTSITIPISVTSLGHHAFQDCSGLTSITIPSSVTSIGQYAFYGCSGLTSIVSEIVRPFAISENVFSDYSKPTLTVPSGTKSAYQSTVGWNKFTNIVEASGSDTSTKRTIHVAAAGTLPNLISESEKYAIEELTLTGELNGTDFRLLRDMAGCNYLGEETEGKLIVLDISEAKIVKGGEKYVDTNHLPGSSGTFRYTVDKNDILSQHLFHGCKFTTLSIPSSVTSIGNDAFAYCSGLTSITIPNSVTSIGDYAFSSCSGLTSITIPNSVTSIGNDAFAYCSGLTSITIPNSVTSIGDFAFCLCSDLTSITIPNSVTSIGDYAFYYCSGLTSITIPNSVTSIGNDAFAYCSGLTSITIPNSVTSIGYAAFSGCSGLTLIKVGSANTKYDSRNSCNAIIEKSSNTLIAGCKSTTIPNSVTSIGNYAFDDCTGLTSITIPNSVTSIGYSAFEGCSGLTSIMIPNSVTSIGSEAFRDCSGLTSIVSEIVRPFEINEDVFSDYSKPTLTVPSGTKSAYQSTAGWKMFTNIVEANDNKDEWLNKIDNLLSDFEVMKKDWSSVLYVKSLLSIVEQRNYFPSYEKEMSDLYEDLVNSEKKIKDGTMTKKEIETLDGRLYRMHKDIRAWCSDAYEVMQSIIETAFECNEGGVIKLGAYKTIENKQETIAFSTMEQLQFSIDIVPNEGYYVKSILLDDKSLSGTNFSSTEIKGKNFSVQFEKNNGDDKIQKLQEMQKRCNDMIAKIDKVYSDLTEGREFIPRYKSALTLVFNEMKSDVNRLLKKIDEYQSNVADLTEETLNSLNKEYDELNSKIFYPFSPLYTFPDYVQGGSFSCSEGGRMKIDNTVEIRNETKLLYSFYPKAFDHNYNGKYPEDFSISLIPDNGYKFVSLKVNGKETTKRSFDCFEAADAFVAIFERDGNIVATANNYTREYGDENPDFTYTTIGGTLNGKPKITCSATKTSPVGTYTIKIEKGSVTNGNVTYVDGTLTITKAPLTVKAKSYTREEGQENPDFEVTYSGFKNWETDCVLAELASAYTEATVSSPPGIYDIVPYGAEASNYSMNYVNGTLTVTEKKDVTFEMLGITYLGTYAKGTAEVRFVKTDMNEVEIPSWVTNEGKTYQVTSIADGVLSNRTFNYVSLPSTVKSVSSSIFSNSFLGALIWNVDASLSQNVFSNMAMSTKSNFLLYVNSKSYAPSNVSNVIVGSSASSITLADATQTRFYCPKEFTAQTITYTHHYGMTTGGNGKGWETIALPFDVQKIEHKTKGVLTPFANYYDETSQRPFWLYEFGSNGFRKTDAIKANTPYIISMPNSPEYDDEYVLAGDVTFSATNAIVAETSSLETSTSNGKAFVPAFAVLESDPSVYALNVTNYLTTYSGSYDAGSMFISNLREVYPFEAYMTSSAAMSRSIRIEFEDETMGMEEILMTERNSGRMKVYSLGGQLLIDSNPADFDALWQQLPSGVYIVNGKKLIK